MAIVRPRARAGIRARAALGLLAGLAVGSAVAGVTEAARFYEDAAQRFDRGDRDGAAVQLKNSIAQNDQQVAAHLLLAKVYAAKGLPRDAQGEFTKALERGADRSEVAVPLARVDLSMGQPEAAIEAVSTSAAFPTPVRVEALALRGAAYTELNKPTLAAQAFDEALALEPNSVVVMLAQGDLLLRTRQLAQARALAAKAIAIEPGNALAWTMDAVVLRDSGDAKGALAAFDKAIALSPPARIEARVGRAALLLDLGRPADAQKDIAALLAVSPRNLRVLTLKGVAARMLGDNAAARAAFAEAAGLVDGVPPALLAQRDQDMMMSAVLHHELGERQKALAQLDALLAKYPDHVAARRLQAAIYIEAGDYARAKPVVDSLRLTLPGDPTLQLQQGEVDLGLGSNAAAITVLQSALNRMDTPQVRLALGKAQIGAGMEEQGLANLESAYAATHDIAAARVLTSVYLRRGQTQRALAVAAAAAKKSPSSPAAITLLGEVEGEAGDFEGARAAFTKATALVPSFGPALIDLAKLDLMQGHADAARTRLQAMAAKGSDPEVLYQLGLVEQRANKPDAALAQFQRAAAAGSREASFAAIDQLLALHRVDEAVAAASDYQQKRPQDLALRLALAGAEIAKGDLPAARAELKNATLLAEFDAALQVRIGRLQLAAGNPAGARYNAQKALAAHPDDIGALVLEVDAAVVAKDFADADRQQQVLTARYPARPETLLSAAGLAMARHQFADAVALYKRVLAISATTENALMLGRAQVISGDPAGAARFYAEWLAKRPKDIAVTAALAEAQYQSGQLAESKRNYLAVLAVDPGNSRMQNNFANVLLAMGDNAGAKTAAEAALRIDPKVPAYMDTLGWALVESGKNDAGLAYVREARLRSPESAEIRVHLAFALAKAGDKANARSELSSAIKMSPGVAAIPVVAQLKGELGM